MGRPTDSPKGSRVTARVENDIKQKFTEYCEKHNIKEAEGVRLAILKLLEDE